MNCFFFHLLKQRGLLKFGFTFFNFYHYIDISFYLFILTYYSAYPVSDFLFLSFYLLVFLLQSRPA